jgi:hypothetical protein
MESVIQFKFREQEHSATYVISENAYPTYIYITLKEAELIKEFGDEICIHSDGKDVLTNHVYTDRRLQLYRSIFDAINARESLQENSKEHTNF